MGLEDVISKMATTTKPTKRKRSFGTSDDSVSDASSSTDLTMPQHLLVRHTASAAATLPLLTVGQSVSPGGSLESPRMRVTHRFRGLSIGGQSSSRLDEALEDEASRASSVAIPTPGLAPTSTPTLTPTDTTDAKDVATGSGTSERQPKRRKMRGLSRRGGGGQSEDVDDDDDDDDDNDEDYRDDIDDEMPRVIVDPVRAANTWQEDEITVYDPNDTDDDGEGVNGIGFRPTRAAALARARKRRQSMAAYRWREANADRARRIQQRGMARATGATRTTWANGPPVAHSGEAEPAFVFTADTDVIPSTVSYSPPPSSSAAGAASVSPRRVRFRETGHETIYYADPDEPETQTEAVATF